MRKPSLSTAIASIALFFSLAGSAHANVRAALAFPAAHRQPSALREAQAAAVQFWHGGVPCDGAVTIAYSATVPSTVGGGGVPLPHPSGWVTFDTPRGILNFAQPASTYVDCVIWLNSRQWAPIRQPRGFPGFCGLIVHEYGHLFGVPDSAQDSPTNITYPMITPRNERVAPCVRRYRLFSSASS